MNLEAVILLLIFACKSQKDVDNALMLSRRHCNVSTVEYDIKRFHDYLFFLCPSNWNSIYLDPEEYFFFIDVILVIPLLSSFSQFFMFSLIFSYSKLFTFILKIPT